MVNMRVDLDIILLLYIGIKIREKQTVLGLTT